MCGIVGYVSTRYSQVNPVMFTQLLVWDQVRGDDSTGVAVIKREPYERFVFKKSMNASDYIQLGGYDTLLKKMGSVGVVIGHNRAATMGAALDKNAHPFEADHITLVHNGSVNNFRALGGDTNSDVDSCHIAHAIAKRGAEAVLPELSGPAVLVWYDSQNDTFNFFRNERRELCYAFDKEGTLWFASEWPMIYALAVRNNVIINDDYAFDHVQEHTWIKFNMKELAKPEIVKVEKKSTSIIAHPNGGHFPPRGSHPASQNKGASDTHGTSQQDKSNDSRQTQTRRTSDSTSGGNSDRYVLTSKNQIKRTNKRLANLKVKIGDILEFRPMVWGVTTPHGSSPVRGTFGGAVKGLTVQTKMFNVPKDYWEDWVDNIEDKSWTMPVEVINLVETKETDFRTKKKFKKQILICRPHEPSSVMLPPSSERNDVEYLLGPGGQKISMKKFNEYTKFGCAQCNQSIAAYEHEEIEWIGSPATPLCTRCSINMREALSN